MQDIATVTNEPAKAPNEGGEDKTTENPTGKLVIKYLQENKHGATVSEIVRYLQTKYSMSQSEDMNKAVETVVEDGINLGILLKSPHSLLARQNACRRRHRRRRSCCCRRRRRRIRRRRCRRRRRRCG